MTLEMWSRPIDWCLNPAAVEFSVHLPRVCSVPFNFQRPLVIITARVVENLTVLHTERRSH